MRIVYLPECVSTNNVVRHIAQPICAGGYVALRTDYQTAGRGQIGNSWESARGENLLISVFLRPKALDVHRHFLMSMAVSLSVYDTVYPLLPDEIASTLKVKWPNDIYVGREKIAGILIENRLSGSRIAESIIGLGLNVNQERFVSKAPNPSSIALLSGKRNKVEDAAEQFCRCLEQRLGNFECEETLLNEYMEKLLWNDGERHLFSDSAGQFEASIASVAPDGVLTLESANGHRRKYLFKEVEHCLE